MGDDESLDLIRVDCTQGTPPIEVVLLRTQHGPMDKVKSHGNVAPQAPDLRRREFAPVKSINWKCDVCSMHYAFSRRVATTARCDRCGGKTFKVYWSIR